MNRSEAFFTLHSETPREGPGEAADVLWAVEVAGAETAQRVCDVACGPGADVPALLHAMPNCHVTGVDKQAAFIERLQRAYGGPRVTATQGDMADLTGPYDFIWCAGAMYFLGVEEALNIWRGALAPGGHIAFSYPAFFTASPSDGAVAFWGGDEEVVLAHDALEPLVEAAGYRVLAQRPVSTSAWEAYYMPKHARIQALRPNAHPVLADILDTSEKEAALWRAHSDETGYLLAVVTPK